MANSKIHCETCPFNEVSAAKVNLNIESYLVTEYFHAHQSSDSSRIRGLKEVEKIASHTLGLDEERLAAARGCGRAMLDGSCEWLGTKETTKSTELPVAINTEQLESMDEEEAETIIDIVATLQGAQLMAEELKQRAHEAAQDNKQEEE